MKPTSVGLIPARSGSKRVPGKNVRPLGGHPMIAYTIAAARDSGVFDAVVVSTDSTEYADIARHYGADVPFIRPADMAGSTSPDIDWILHALAELEVRGRTFDAFSILRPTSPFRQPETIRRAWSAFVADPHADSLRAIEKCNEHPGKMWIVHGQRMLPLMPLTIGGVPWHSNQYAALPEIYVQNASLEIAWVRMARQQRSIAGTAVVPFVTQGHEGFDVNNLADWLLAEHYISSGEAKLPHVAQSSFLARK